MQLRRLTLERFGGLAGLPAQPLVVERAALPESQAQQLEALAQAVLNETDPNPAPAPDAFGYELTIETADDRRVIGFEYARASDALCQLVTAVRALSKD